MPRGGVVMLACRYLLQPVTERRLGCRLHPQVERRVHLEAERIQRLLTIFFFQHTPDMLDVIRRRDVAAPPGRQDERPLVLASRRGSYITAPYYVEHVRRVLEEKYGEKALYALGFQVHTALNLRMQAAAEAALRDGLQEVSAREHYDAATRHLSA